MIAFWLRTGTIVFLVSSILGILLVRQKGLSFDHAILKIRSKFMRVHIEPDMIQIKHGSFRMGDIQTVTENEQPVHPVEIQKTFKLGRYEVTFAEYDRFALATGGRLPNDRGWGRGRQPVVDVSWYDAVAYTKWLSEQTGKRYRLPSEAEWEYAARAGTDTKFWWGNDLIKGMANCAECGSQWDKKQTAPVGSFKPNSFGLYDTAGNVWEWVEDCWHSDYKGAPTDGRAWLEETGKQCADRVLRGGPWNYSPSKMRSSHRDGLNAYWRYSTIGFRVAEDPS